MHFLVQHPQSPCCMEAVLCHWACFGRKRERNKHVERGYAWTDCGRVVNKYMNSAGTGQRRKCRTCSYCVGKLRRMHVPRIGDSQTLFCMFALVMSPLRRHIFVCFMAKGFFWPYLRNKGSDPYSAWMKYVVCLHLYIPWKFGERGSTPRGATGPSLSFLFVCLFIVVFCFSVTLRC